jgi:hypothetical protein
VRWFTACGFGIDATNSAEEDFAGLGIGDGPEGHLAGANTVLVDRGKLTRSKKYVILYVIKGGHPHSLHPYLAFERGNRGLKTSAVGGDPRCKLSLCAVRCLTPTVRRPPCAVWNPDRGAWSARLD